MSTVAAGTPSGVAEVGASSEDRVMQISTPAPPAAGHAPTATLMASAPVDADANEALARDRRSSVVVRAWRRMRREPSLMFTVAYLLVSFIGLWANYWFYLSFHLPILEYMQATDYLVAGLRDPMYALIMLAAVAGIFLVSWPDVWRRSHPVRVEQLRRHWWGRWLFPNHDLMRWKGLRMTPETGIVLAALWGTAWLTAFYVQGKAQDIRDDGAGRPLQVMLAGDTAAQPGEARLLGTSSAFVFLWWPAQRRAEAVPIESVGRLTVLPRAAKPTAPTKEATASAQATPMPDPQLVPAAEPATSAK